MNRNFLFLSFLAAVLFSACSSEESNGGKEATGNMQVSTSLPVGSRVTETSSSSNGLVTEWESTDKLNIFHPYTKTGSTALMVGLEFQNTSSAGSNGVFAYTGTETGYLFSPGNYLYAYNQLPTVSNFTQTYNTSGDNFTLNLSGFSAQDGTVGNLRNYDAMYGVSIVGSDGTLSKVNMKHLTSVIRLNITNKDFTSLLTKVILTCSSSSATILPSTGSFMLSNKSGTVSVANTTLTGATSWTVNNIAASSGTASVYLMAFPFQNITGTLNIEAKTSDGSSYTRSISLSSFSPTSGKVEAYTMALIKAPNPIPYTGKYYRWDATDVYPSAFNTIISGVAVNSCKNCPTYDQIQMYLGAGVMWDTQNKGLWLMKPGYIKGFSAGSATKITTATPTQVSNYNNPSGQYFFLPAAGYRTTTTSTTENGTSGEYWSSTPYSAKNTAYYLAFQSSTAIAALNDVRSFGFSLW